ncbi:hypothetical protein MBRA1_000661 [Malassezia brasiliensis]|uniref:Uncharacterized protein n=1 Tax=Malassezia brasiliensis TaxID=1821822 RepID=A0AAF0IMG9_9BASI|nr:hypothetical protein MBRA1_000661 [Malassezia brasiliensis]
MTSPFSEAMDPFSLSFSEFDDSFMDLSGNGQLPLDETLDTVDSTPRALQEEFIVHRPPGADLAVTLGKSPRMGILDSLSEPSTWLSQSTWTATLHPDETSGGLESSSSTTSTSSMHSIARTSHATADTTKRGPFGGGSSAESEHEFGDVWNATMHASPDVPSAMSSESSDSLLRASPMPMHTPNQSPARASEATSVPMPARKERRSFDLHTTTPPSLPSSHDAALAHGVLHTPGTPGDRSAGDVTSTPPVSLASHAFRSSPLQTRTAPMVMHGWGEPYTMQQVQALSAMGYTSHADPSTLNRFAGTFAPLGMHAMSSAAPQPLFVDPQSTQAETTSSHGSWDPSGMPASWTTHTPTLSTASLQQALPISPTRRGRPSMAKTPRKAQSTPLFQITTMGSMMALREANAMQAATKPSPAARKPMTLSFVNYGIDDAEELCSAVAPSGSYKVPLRGYARDSDGEEEADDTMHDKPTPTPTHKPLRHAASADTGAAGRAPPAATPEIKRRQTTTELREQANQQGG